jgi:hypothetical protein
MLLAPEQRSHTAVARDRFVDVLRVFEIVYAMTGGVILQWLFGYNFSVAVWVGYIALYGVAVQTGVVMVVYLHEALDKRIGERLRSARGAGLPAGAPARLRQGSGGQPSPDFEREGWGLGVRFPPVLPDSGRKTGQGARGERNGASVEARAE